MSDIIKNVSDEIANYIIPKLDENKTLDYTEIYNTIKAIHEAKNNKNEIEECIKDIETYLIYYLEFKDTQEILNIIRKYL